MYHGGLTRLILSVIFVLCGGCQLYISSCEAGQVLCVKSNGSEDCPTHCPCHSLNAYARNSSSFKSDIVLEFLPGIHRLDISFYVAGINNVTFRAITDHSGLSLAVRSVDVHCSASYFMFTDITDLRIEGLNFYDCGAESPNNNPFFYNSSMNFELVHNLHISFVHMNRSIGPGISATNIFGTSTIDHSCFLNNIGYAPHIRVQYYEPYSLEDRSLLNITHSVIRYGGGGSISILFDAESTVDIVFSNVTTFGSKPGSTARGDIEILLQWAIGVTVVIADSHIEASAGTGVYIAPPDQIDSFIPAIIHVSIVNCLIAGHKQGAVYPFVWSYGFGLTINNSRIVHNMLQSSLNDTRRASGLTLTFRPETQSLIILNNVTFEDNIHVDIPLGMKPATVYAVYAQNVEIRDCSFLGNQGTGILSYHSTVVLAGTLTFINNSAYQGAAIALYGSSYVVVPNNTYVDFYNNSVSHDGGAVYIDSSDHNVPLFLLSVLGERPPKCFLQLPDIKSSADLEYLNVTLKFIDNRAQNGGSAIYGDLMDECSVAPKDYSDIVYGYELLNESFVFESNFSNLSMISSNPWRVCLCTEKGVPDCTIIFVNVTQYPGEQFSISAVTVGQRFGTTSGSIYAHFLSSNENNGSHANLGEFRQHSQETTADTCTNLLYSIASNRSQEVLTLTTTDTLVVKYLDNKTVQKAIDHYQQSKQISSELLSFPVYINITLLPCPLGFVLLPQSGSPPRCTCNPVLTTNGLTCNLSSQTVRRGGTVWVSAYSGGDNDGVIVHKYCPFDYCKSEQVNVSLDNRDTQCAFHRSGILCGACESGRSLALGSSRCLFCSNYYISLLVPFALSGVALVVFIWVLNLTVAVGTINGLIFYANIIKASQVVFFPAGETNILTVFISWLNLDLGIETCFFDGLSPYGKSWLQFVFPLYVWLILIVIVILAHCSSTIARVFGNNVVPILATLFLLSYAKLLRAIITVLSVTTLDYPDGSQIAVWSYDGNIEYLSAKHIPLFMVAVAFLVILWLPYTVLLLFVQFLLRMSSQYKLIRFVIKLKPFFDSYHGPLKDRHRYWVGVLLLVRGVLLVTFAFNSTNDPGFNLIAMSVAVLLLVMYTSVVGHVYKNVYLSILETSFLFNILLLTAGTFYIQLADGNQAALVYTSVSVAFIQFLAIVIFHGFTAFKRRHYQAILSRPQLRQLPFSSEVSESVDSRDISSIQVQYKPEGHPTMVGQYGEFFTSRWFNRLREPLLDD